MYRPTARSFWEYSLLEVHWWGFRSLVFQKQRHRWESTWVDAFCWVALPSSPCRVPGEFCSSRNPVQRNSRRVRVLKEEKKEEESSQTLFKNRTNICSGVQTWAVGVDRTPGGYSNSKTRGSRWAVWTSQGQMDMLFFGFCWFLFISESERPNQPHPLWRTRWETRQGNRVREKRAKV